MAKITRFEDLQSWQKARQFTNAIYDLTGHLEFAKDFRLRDQIQSAAGSTMHNIAEGFDAGSDAEFIRFLKMARRSASEVQSQLTWLWIGDITEAERIRTDELATEVIKTNQRSDQLPAYFQPLRT